MADNKVKTKTAILQELESIKGLLFEQDDIPILQEIIDENGELTLSIPDALNPNAVNQETLDQEDLDALHEAFQTLKHTIVKAAENSSTTEDASPQSQNLTLEAQQAPLFHDKTDDDELNAEADTEPDEASLNQQKLADHQDPELIDTDAEELHEPELTFTLSPEDASPTHVDSQENPYTYSSHEPTNNSIEEPLPFYGNSQGDEVINKSANNLSKSQPGRSNSGKPKASGENPFLPQHIRARLHGNNPPPLFDTTSVPTPRSRSTSLFKTEAGHSSARQDLIRELVDKVMPQIEQDLRQRLQLMTDEELQKMREL
jgi:hypothetical protein